MTSQRKSALQRITPAGTEAFNIRVPRCCRINWSVDEIFKEKSKKKKHETRTIFRRSMQAIRTRNFSCFQRNSNCKAQTSYIEHNKGQEIRTMRADFEL